MDETGVLPPSEIYFHTASPFAKKALYFLSNGGSYVCSSKYEIKRDNYPQYLLMHVKEGSMEFGYGYNKYEAKANSLAFLDCYNPHFYRALEDETAINWFHFTGNASQIFFDTLYHYNGCVFSLENNWKIPEYMEEILHMMKDSNVNEQSASIIIQRIFYELEVISNQSEVASVDQTISRSLSFIETHYMEDIGLKDISEHVNLSSFHFSRVFKKQMNYSPHQYLISYRINKAKDFLHNTTLPINDIALKCGFNSSSHFVNTFKRYTNLSPNNFRKMKL
jgi:AraC family transcriptional regulator